MNFSEAKIKFDTEYKNKNVLSRSLVTVDGKFMIVCVCQSCQDEPIPTPILKLILVQCNINRKNYYKYLCIHGHAARLHQLYTQNP